jgi:hypothetical protein
MTGVKRTIGLVVVFGAMVSAQDGPKANPNDPRVGLKAGYHDAGVAMKNMELVSTLPKADGFFDPKVPAGGALPPEPDPNAPPPSPNAPQPVIPGLNFANSDLAFSANHAVMGNFNGFNTYDIENPKKPRLVASIVCPGGQGDVSIYGNLLFMSVEQTRGRVDCGTQGVSEKASSERFRGVRIFDIRDLNKPKQLAAIQTCRGSHTHTLVTSPNDKDNIYIYGSGTGMVRPGEEMEGCSDKKPDDDPNTSLYSIDVIQVPVAAPQNAKLVNRPRIFSDTSTGAIAGLWQGGDHGPNTQKTSVTNQCHDITVFPEIGLAAGACSGNGILLDIKDPVHPVRLDFAADKNFAYWHSATFNNDGTKVIFTDEWGGGTRPRCRAQDPLTWGADAIFDIVDRKLVFRGYFKMPAVQTDTENCVAHNGSLVPVPGRDIMVQAWYQGGVSVFDFTDAAHAQEIAYFDRGPLDAKTLILGGFWSAYWYNGAIYGSEISRGVDIFKLKPSEFLTQNELDAAMLIRSNEFNPQEQPRVTWPASTIVAKAYLDQLVRSKAVTAERAKAVGNALDKVDGLKGASDKNAMALVGQVNEMANQFEKDAASANAVDAKRMKSLAETIKARTTRLKS